MRRIFGKYKGKIIDIDDPEDLGRIRAFVYDLGMETAWAEVCTPFKGLYFPPDLEDDVWIEFEGGDTSRPVCSGFAIKKCKEMTKVNEEKVIRTNGFIIRVSDKLVEIIREETGKGVVITDEEFSLGQGGVITEKTLPNCFFNGASMRWFCSKIVKGD